MPAAFPVWNSVITVRNEVLRKIISVNSGKSVLARKKIPVTTHTYIQLVRTFAVRKVIAYR